MNNAIDSTDADGVPLALRGTAEAEVKAFVDYLATTAGNEQRLSLRDELEALAEFNIDDMLSDIVAATESAEGILGRLDDLVDAADAAAWRCRDIRDGYVASMGVPEALVVVAKAISTNDSPTLRTSLFYGLRLAARSDLKLARDMIDALAGLGMPSIYRNRAINSYRQAFFGWAYRGRIGPSTTKRRPA